MYLFLAVSQVRFCAFSMCFVAVKVTKCVTAICIWGAKMQARKHDAHFGVFFYVFNM